MDTITPEMRAALMSRIRGKNTKPELAVRRMLFALGYRFRVHIKELPGCPDIVFFRRRAVIFVHGCFWHRHNCEKAYTPKTRHEFWQQKFSQNVERDQRSYQLLAEAEWRIFVAWECEIERDYTFVERVTEFLGPPRV